MIGIIFIDLRHCGIICHDGEHDNDDEVDDVVPPRGRGLSSYHLICDGGFAQSSSLGGVNYFAAILFGNHDGSSKGLEVS